jgi:peptidoglycan/LPS O-acetylase OafA/YrhL
VEQRYYRPELDALRFFAFLGVLVHHGPDTPRIGGFGLSMFFMLSAYLITELLTRERDQTGTISWKFFFIRRALRIWPLYFAAVFLLADHRAWLGLVLFVANWSSIDSGRLAAPLWSLSIEEQFYLLWPPVVKFRAEKIVAIACIVAAFAWIWIFAGRGWKLWYDTPAEFLFFATGALISIAKPKTGDRAFLVVAGSILLLVSSQLGIGSADTTGLTRVGLLVGYATGALGCAALFIAILDIKRVPKRLAYAGRISYGLYVFHSGALEIARHIPLPAHTALRMFTVDAAALVLSFGAAHLSYQYFEKPFLVLKERFAVVKSSIPFAVSG